MTPGDIGNLSLPKGLSVGKDNGKVTLTIDDGVHPTEFFQTSSQGGVPHIGSPGETSGNFNDQMQDVSTSTFDLGDLMAQILALAAQESDTFTKENVAQIQAAQTQAQFSMSQADDMRTEALATAIGGFVMAGLAIGMSIVSMIGTKMASTEAEEVAGSSNFSKTGPEVDIEETEPKTTSRSRTTEVEDDEDEDSISRDGSVEGEGPLETEDDPQSEQVRKNKAKLEDEEVNEKGFNEKERSEMFEKAFSRSFSKFQIWSQIGTSAGQAGNAGFQIWAGDKKADAQMKAGFSQLAGTTQQSAAGVASQMNSFFSDVRGMISSVMSSEFQLASKV